MSIIFFCCFLILLALSAFFSMSETALVSISPQKAKALSLNNPSHEKEIFRWLQHPHELLTLIVTGNTLVNILFASLMTSYALYIFTSWNPRIIDTIAWLFSTFILVVFGEMVPKIMARSIPEEICLVVLPILSRMKVVMMPIIKLVSSVLEFFMGATTSMNKPTQPKAISPDEFKSLIEEGEKNSPKEATQSMGLMRKALELHDRSVEDIMTPLNKIDFVEVDPTSKKIRTPDLILDLIVENGHTRTPIKKGGRFVGFIHSKDLLSLSQGSSRIDIMASIRQPIDIKVHTSVRDALEIFRNSGIHMAFVYNAQGQMCGLVTLEDVLEEMTGEILDEYDLTA